MGGFISFGTSLMTKGDEFTFLVIHTHTIEGTKTVSYTKVMNDSDNDPYPL